MYIFIFYILNIIFFGTKFANINLAKYFINGNLQKKVQQNLVSFFVSPKYIEDEADADGEWAAVDDGDGESLKNIFDELDDI